MNKSPLPISPSIARFGKLSSAYQHGAVEGRATLGQLVPYKRQARDPITEESIAELAETIKEVGILQPLLVRPIPADYDFELLPSGLVVDVTAVKYEIIAGERRWHAARLAGLLDVPILVKALDDELVDKIHLYENIHRENLSNMELAKRVQADLDLVDGNVELVAAKYKKNKSWVSKLSSVARGGEVMHELIDEGVTADRAVLSIVSSLERKDPVQARALVQELKSSASPNKRAVVEQHMKAKKEVAKAPAAKTAKGEVKASKPPKEPSWREEIAKPLVLSASSFIGVEISPHSDYVSEFAELSRKHGRAHLATKHRHPNSLYALVSFDKDDKTLRAYKADELRLTSIE